MWTHIWCTESKPVLMPRIVGDDDGGKMFSEKQYEEYKRKNPHKVAALKKNFMDIAG